LSDRINVESRVQRLVSALEARDISTVLAGLSPEGTFIWPNFEWRGRGEWRAALEQYLATWRAVKLSLRHLLIDASHQTAALEWVCRYADGNKEGCQEVLGGTVLQFDEKGLLGYCRTYLDPVRSRSLSSFDAPWPDPGWTPHPNPGPPPGRAFAEQLIQANARAWSSHDVAQLSGVIHDEICICPPWDYRVGRANVERGAQIYFDQYQDTQVTPKRIVFDPTQPYFGVCEQAFACTNPDTGQRGEDADFAFFEIAQGKLRYWRTYFDTARSVQVIEKTAGFLSQ
jgi:hypothetical protein